MEGNSIELRLADNSRANTWKYFSFVVDLCSNLQPYSGATCIGDVEVERAVVNETELITRQMSQYFVPVSESGQSKLKITKETNLSFLSDKLANYVDYRVQKNSITL